MRCIRLLLYYDKINLERTTDRLNGLENYFDISYIPPMCEIANYIKWTIIDGYQIMKYQGIN
ncbi:hypothetical protein HZS_8092 [Henneguya salminicola]|nr:hypothetical protein HZS_8092 [Henneguya salminicola]